MDDNDTDHEHEFLNTFVRTLSDGREIVIYSGELPTDKQVLMCEDCGATKEKEDENDSGT